jgi:CoA:oxalate CoA-transferase
MLDCQIAVLENAIVRYSATDRVPGPIGTRHPLATPFQAFPTSDGYMVLALSWGVPNQWELFCAIIGRPELIDDARFETSALRTSSRRAGADPQRGADAADYGGVDRRVRRDRVAVRAAEQHPQAVAQPQVLARDMLVELQHPRMSRPLKVPNTPVEALSRRAACAAYRPTSASTPSRCSLVAGAGGR